MRTTFFLAAVILHTMGAAEQDTLAGRWDLDEGRDAHIHDASGHANHGLASGVRWVELESAGTQSRYALEFVDRQGRVNCGNGPSLDITGPVTLEAWVFPTAPAPSETGICGKSFDSYGMTFYTDGHLYWYVGSGGNKCSAPLPLRQWSCVAATFDGKTMRLYVNGECVDTAQSEFARIPHGGDFFIGCIAKGQPTESFRGLIGAVRVHAAALPEDTIRARFDGEQKGYPGPPAQHQQIMAWPYHYPEDGRIVLDLDMCYVYPLREGETAWVELRHDGEAVQRHPLPDIPRTGLLRDVALHVGALEPGEYELRIAAGNTERTRSEWHASFRRPQDRRLPAPNERTAPPLPPASEPPAYALDIRETGGIILHVNGARFLLESTYSYPHGGENRLTDAPRTGGKAEPAWSVEVTPTEASAWRVTAAGQHYRVDRTVEPRPDRVLVRDTLTNLRDEPVGIQISNHLVLPEAHGLKPTLLPNPSVFLGKEGLGLGMVALDDVYLEHYQTFHEDGRAGIRDDIFGLDSRASYTLEWALYLNPTGAYYDFVNAARRDMGYAPRVEGGFAFVDRREPPSREFVERRGLGYASIGCLGHAADDSTLSLEGVEFVEYPQECALLKETFAETRRRFPEMNTMFHIAHSLYTTNRPEELFPDSRVINAEGRQTDYGNQNPKYYRKYFSEERVEQGYRWYIFYPTMENRFGRYMLDAIDYMLEEVGVNSMFADGFTHGYGGRFTWDRWDGHTVEIDPATKTIVRKYGSVNLFAQEVLIETARRLDAAGGVVIANSYPGTRSVHRENVLYCLETAGGGKVCSRLHFAPSVIALGNPAQLVSDRDVYEDILDKLAWGGLYFYYGEQDVAPNNIVTRMYPITVEEFHAGIIKGRERIITTHSGVYGWRGDHALHAVHHFDGRGTPRPPRAITTVDKTGCRTEVELGRNESAVIERIPVALDMPAPVNVRVEQYGAAGIRLWAAGTGSGSMSVRAGGFVISENTDYAAAVDGTKTVVRPKDGILEIPLALCGPARVVVTPTAGPVD